MGADDQISRLAPIHAARCSTRSDGDLKRRGAWLEAADDRRIFDAISSWWVITHGHRHPHIVQAIKGQIDRLDQVIFAGFTHEPAEKLARHLVAITPPELEYVFFSDSGSTSVEVALKMALGFWQNKGSDAPAFWRWKARITVTPSEACRSASAGCSTHRMLLCCLTSSESRSLP
jgi:adenosylmethionine-8-amino-7-oxononanoate aminotransferase